MTWPWPGDTELTIARKIAIAYRTHLHTANPAVCDALDQAMRDYGQRWVFPRAVVYDDTDAVTTAVAAELVDRKPRVIRQWAALPHPDDPDRRLLPAFGWDGPSRTYLVSDVRAAAHLVISRTTYRRPAPT